MWKRSTQRAEELRKPFQSSELRQKGLVFFHAPCIGPGCAVLAMYVISLSHLPLSERADV